MTPVDILPFVTPVTDPTITDMDFSVAVDDWNDTLSRILKLNTKAFWAALLANASLARFLNSFLGEFAAFRGSKGDIWVMELEEVVRRVFMIYRRISESMAEPVALEVARELFADQEDISDPGSALLDLGLVSTSVLMDLAGIYGTADPEGVSRLVGSLLQHTPRLINDFRVSTGTVVQIIRKVQKKFEKGISGGAGKGKGKGKGVSPAMSPEPGMVELDEEKVAEAMQYASALSDVAYALDAVSAASPMLALELQQHPLFLECLSGCYNYTLPVLNQTLVDSRVGGEVRAQSILNFLRLRMLSIVNNILDSICKQQLPMSDSLDSGMSPQLDEDATATLTDSLCEVIVNLYEQSPLQEHMTPMADAPMILDLEIQFNISEKLSDIIVENFMGENDRLNHWVVILHDLRDFNPATQTFIYEHNMQKSEKMARELSTGVYINQDKGRSGSTITSHTSVQNITVAPMSVSQEEDYVKRTILISQLQDLFPDLGDGFLEACLMSFRDDPEVVTMKLLEEDLPSDLATMDRSTARSMPHRVETAAPTSMALVKASMPDDADEQDVLSSRRNIFDGDEFDVFSGNVVDKSKMSRGKKTPVDAEVVLDDKSFVSQHKSAILQAVETMYDDEYDDTYDSMGLNSTGADFKLVDDIDARGDEGVTRHAGGRAQMIDPSIEHEEVLISMYTGQKDVFNRSAEARRSKKRQELRNLTKMSDEQLEGWAIMFGRNPRKAAIAQKYEYSGQQTELAAQEPIDKRRGGRMPFVDKNAAAAATTTTVTAAKPQQQPQQQRQQQQKQTPRQQDGKKGPSSQQQQQQQGSQTPKPHSSSSNSTNDSQSPNARDKAKNERQKSSKANHNRRNQHAKKMASMNP
ncbi:hypothetical protein BGZ67_003441 [Mortierella alpina]|nr:hypothetical protein BGZ67_003441 [Mortierella alpina]